MWPNPQFPAYLITINSSVLTDDQNLKISGYNSVRADHPLNTKHYGVLTHYKSFIPTKLSDVLERMILKSFQKT